MKGFSPCKRLRVIALLMVVRQFNTIPFASTEKLVLFQDLKLLKPLSVNTLRFNQQTLTIVQ